MGPQLALVTVLLHTGMRNDACRHFSELKQIDIFNTH